MRKRGSHKRHISNGEPSHSELLCLTVALRGTEKERLKSTSIPPLLLLAVSHLPIFPKAQRVLYMWVCMSLVLLPQKWPRILEGNACLTWSFPDRGGVLSRNSKLSHTWGATRTQGRRTWKPLRRPSPSSLAMFYAIGSVGKENRAPNHYRPHLFSVLGQGFSNLSVRTTNPRILVKRRF